MSHDLDLSSIHQITFVSRIEYLAEVDSTNTVATRLVAEGLCEIPCLVIAERQNAGRGRGSNRWWSSPGALTFSLVLELDVALDRMQVASLAAGLAICQTLERFAPAADFSIKWPNDVYVNGRKVCGILIERPASSRQTIVVGIGINLNNSVRSAPIEISKTADSMCDLTGWQLDATDVLIECLRQLERRFGELRDSTSVPVAEWRSYDLLRGRPIKVNVYSDIVNGICLGIEPTGALLVETSTGLRRLSGGTVIGFGDAEWS